MKKTADEKCLSVFLPSYSLSKKNSTQNLLRDTATGILDELDIGVLATLVEKVGAKVCRQLMPGLNVVDSSVSFLRHFVLRGS